MKKGGLGTAFSFQPIRSSNAALAVAADKGNP